MTRFPTVPDKFKRPLRAYNSCRSANSWPQIIGKTTAFVEAYPYAHADFLSELVIGDAHNIIILLGMWRVGIGSRSPQKARLNTLGALHHVIVPEDRAQVSKSRAYPVPMFNRFCSLVCACGFSLVYLPTTWSCVLDRYDPPVP